MRGMKTVRAVGGIDDTFIEEAMPDELITVRSFPWKYTAMAAAVALVICVGVLLMIHNANSFDEQVTDNSSEVSGQWEKKHVSTDSSSADNSKEDQSDDMSVCEQYSSFLFNSAEYTACMTKIDPAKLTLMYETAPSFSGTANSLDHRRFTEDKWVQICSINGISDELAVAICFLPEEITDPYTIQITNDNVKQQLFTIDNNDDYYVYMNTEFKTGSLYSLAYACTLRENAQFGSAYRYDGDTTIEFTGLDKHKVYDILFDNSQQCAQIKEADEFMSKNGFKPYITISTTVEIIGRSNFSISLSKDGYLFTNIFKTARVYNIGKERVQRFKEYLEAQCKGYELVYDSSSDDSSQYASE